MDQFSEERRQTTKDIPRSLERSGSLGQARRSRNYYPRSNILTESLTSFSQNIQRASNTAPRRPNLRNHAKFKETMDIAQKASSQPHIAKVKQQSEPSRDPDVYYPTIRTSIQTWEAQASRHCRHILRCF